MPKKRIPTDAEFKLAVLNRINRIEKYIVELKQAVEPKDEVKETLEMEKLRQQMFGKKKIA